MGDLTSDKASALPNEGGCVSVALSPEFLDPRISLSEALRPHQLELLSFGDFSICSKFQSPFTWSQSRKVLVLSAPFMASTLAAYSAGAYALASSSLLQQFSITDTQVNAGITIFVAGFGFTPMILAPVSETHGRYWVYVGSGLVFLLGTLGCALSKSYVAMMVSRFLTGCGAAVFATLTGGVVSDLYRKEDRNIPMAMYTLSIMIGTGLGPLISGTVVDRLGWRWIFFIQLIAIGVTTASLLLCFAETSSTCLLGRKCHALNKMQLQTTSGVTLNFFPKARNSSSLDISILWRSFAFPLKLLITEPAVFLFSAWVSFAWAILYMQFSSIGIVFKSVYDFDNAQVGAVYTAVIVGSSLSFLMAASEGAIIRRLTPRYSTQSTPEQRLLSPCIQSVLLPIGLFWFMLSAKPEAHWISPALAIGSCTMGIFSIYLAVFNYLADTYQRFASSALAAQSMCRNLLAGIFPLVTRRMLTSLTLAGTGGLLGGLGLMLTAIPWVLYFSGHRIRARSLFAKNML
ncbi:unnamed protein product [Penicillium olsonii]|uniref:Major facilitator superfamily (MFS) profile domain-containing protein n=1 Tax=Penicillium olsonii TaxID=99116 RepID=A0A9W4HQD6_PENOL|nr:unnamed protein product [Penicillium olsonii]